MKRATGFTLLEVLVVVVLIGVILSFATLSVDTGLDRKLSGEAARLHALLRLAADEAVLDRAEIGVHFEREGYRFSRLEQGRWLPLADDEEFRPRRLPEAIALELRLADGPLPENTEDAPQVVLFSSGEATPFDCRLSAPGLAGYRLRADVAGRLSLEAGDEP